MNVECEKNTFNAQFYENKNYSGNRAVLFISFSVLAMDIMLLLTRWIQARAWRSHQRGEVAVNRSEKTRSKS